MRSEREVGSAITASIREVSLDKQYTRRGLARLVFSRRL